MFCMFNYHVVFHQGAVFLHLLLGLCVITQVKQDTLKSLTLLQTSGFMFVRRHKDTVYSRLKNKMRVE